MRIFGERDLREYLGERLSRLQKEVHAEGNNQLLNVNETQYIDYLVERYRVDPLILHWDDMTVSEREELIPAERFPFDFGMDEFNRGKRYPKQVITYEIPFTGDRELLRCKPSTSILWTQDLRVQTNNVYIDIVNWRNASDEIKRDATTIIDKLKSQAANVALDVENFNRGLESRARRVLAARKEEILKRMNVLNSLGVPLRKAEDVPETFSVPKVEKRTVIKPTTSSETYFPEPTLDNETYQQILQVLHEFGMEMERHPDIYEGKGEEALRDLLIMVLSPNFQSTTGETFNRAGKTDILIRHEKSNVFVAECKFWRGIKAFHETIDQALSYLTWRDSKAAIMCFIGNKKLDPVLQQIDAETSKHPCFVKHKGRKQEGWFGFEFHLIDDETRSVQLAVLCFHLPKE